jgi:hypothetical protein
MVVDSGPETFLAWLREEYRSDGSYERLALLHSGDTRDGYPALRLHVMNRSYYEVRVVDTEVQAGLGTESRIVNEAIEQMILDNGGDLSELLADELCDLGEEPLAMDHFFERPAFRYVVRLPVTSADDLATPAHRSRVKTILKASRILFQACIDDA